MAMAPTSGPRVSFKPRPGPEKAWLSRATKGGDPARARKERAKVRKVPFVRLPGTGRRRIPEPAGRPHGAAWLRQDPPPKNQRHKRDRANRFRHAASAA